MKLTALIIINKKATLIGGFEILCLS